MQKVNFAYVLRYIYLYTMCQQREIYKTKIYSGQMAFSKTPAYNWSCPLELECVISKMHDPHHIQLFLGDLATVLKTKDNTNQMLLNKNNSENNGNSHKRYKVLLINCFVPVIS